MQSKTARDRRREEVELFIVEQSYVVRNSLQGLASFIPLLFTVGCRLVYSMATPHAPIFKAHFEDPELVEQVFDDLRTSIRQFARLDEEEAVIKMRLAARLMNFYAIDVEDDLINAIAYDVENERKVYGGKLALEDA